MIETTAAITETSARRFAILIHDHPFVHWDFLIEAGDSAWTWRLLESPARWELAVEPVTLIAEPITDHRLLYFEYEGPLSRERGRVVRWDAGLISPQRGDESGDAWQLRGSKLIGVLRMAPPNNSGQRIVSFSPSGSSERA